MLRRALHDQTTWSGEMQAVRSDRSAFDVQVAAACNRNQDGEPLGVVLSFVDTTDRKRAELAIREAERQRVMLESLGAACHHLSQPATVLMGNLDILQQLGDNKDGKRVSLVESSIEAMREIGVVLRKLNAVNEYKTRPYLQSAKGSETDESRILEI